MRLVPVESVKEGSFLAKSIFDDNGRILLREGVRLTDVLMSRVKSLKIYSVYVIDEYSDKEIEDVIKPELRQKAIRQVKDTFMGIGKLGLTPESNKSKTNTSMKEKAALFDNIRALADNLIDELVSKKNVLVNLVDIKSMDNYTYQHCVNVSVLSLILGIELKLNRVELYDLCIGALMHDLGKVMVPKEILQKSSALSTKDFELIKGHSLKGFEYARKMGEISAISRAVILQHHERFDGKGYPDQKKGADIHRYARIVAIADVYDALTSDRPYRRALSPSEALEYIMANGGSQFDYEMVKAFSRIIVPYPEGSIVRLSTNEFAVVDEVFSNYPLRPKVKIVKSNIPARINSFVNLVQALDVVIEDQVYVVDGKGA